MAPAGPPPIPPPSYEEDSAAQAAARGYVYAYPPYGYPTQVCSCIASCAVNPDLMVAFTLAYDARDGTPRSSRCLYAWSLYAANAVSAGNATSHWLVS